MKINQLGLYCSIYRPSLLLDKSVYRYAAYDLGFIMALVTSHLYTLLSSPLLFTLHLHLI